MDNVDRLRVFTCSSSSQDKKIINSLMLRFRPIAPKPVANGSSTDWNPASKNSLASCSVRTKRKYVRVKKRNDHYKRRTTKIKPVPSDLEQDKDQTTEMESEKENKLFTLQLLPVDDLVKDSSTENYNNNKNNNHNHVDPTVKISSDLRTSTTMIHQVNGGGGGTDRRIRVIETVVTVESMIDTCMDDDCTDVERMNSLEKDTCPGFISDGSGKVWCINEAYKKMVRISSDNKEEEEAIRVKLEIKEKILPYLRNYSAFSCWVKLQYAWQKEKYPQSQMMMMIPCDVWKMRSFDGFAWRLDVKAALSLAI